MKFKELTSEDKLNNILKSININNPALKKIEGLLQGQFHSLEYGTGFNFNEIREYQNGDDVRFISWNAFAKTNKLHTKEFYSEKEANCYFLIDVTYSMFCGEKQKLLINTCAFLLSYLSKYCNKLSCVFFSQDIEYYFPLANFAIRSNVLFEYLFNLEKLNSQNSAEAKLEEVLSSPSGLFKKKGFVFLFSGFINMESLEKSIFSFSHNHNMYAFQILDDIDFKLENKGHIYFIDPETREKTIVNSDDVNLISAYSLLMEKKQKSLEKFLHSLGCKHIILKNDYFR